MYQKTHLHYVVSTLHDVVRKKLKKNSLYSIHVGIFIFTFFFKSHLGFQKNTQDFCVFFLFMEIEFEKSQKKRFRA